MERHGEQQHTTPNMDAICEAMEKADTEREQVALSVLNRWFFSNFSFDGLSHSMISLVANHFTDVVKDASRNPSLRLQNNEYVVKDGKIWAHPQLYARAVACISTVRPHVGRCVYGQYHH